MTMTDARMTASATDAGGTTPAGLTPVDLDQRIIWSIEIRDAADDGVLLDHAPGTVLKTASIGKLFLLMELARQMDDGDLDPHETIDRDAMSPDDRCEDSGLLYLLDQRTLSVGDLGFLVGAMSDNYATNLLVERIGLGRVRRSAREQGFRRSALLDYVRMVRPVGEPEDMSCGCAHELCDYMMRLQAGTLVSPGVSARIERWLGADADTSMAAGAFDVDPLAHWDDESFLLRHKTGTESDVRCDVGFVRRPSAGRTVAYAILANWDGSRYGDLRHVALADMRALGMGMRRWLLRE